MPESNATPCRASTPEAAPTPEGLGRDTHDPQLPGAASGELTDPNVFVWNVEPIEIALEAARVRREQATEDRPEDRPEEPKPFVVCTEVGRRLLLMHFAMSGWVLRRVEKVQFVSDRRISRNSTIEFRVPPEAPVISVPNTEPRWLIPLSVMRRHTLVNLDLRAEDSMGMSLLGLRFTQMLDESLLRAAARLACPDVGDHAEIDEFIGDTISGAWHEVQARWNQYEEWRRVRGTDAAAKMSLDCYFADDTFRATLERLWHNFTLYVTVPVKDMRHRMLRLGFEERVDWRDQRPNLATESQPETQSESQPESQSRSESQPQTPSESQPAGEDRVRVYQPDNDQGSPASRRRAWTVSELRRFFGWRSTGIRFLVPSAENCASYHFEFTAPAGLWVTKAAFVGGRPNLRDTPSVTSWDAVETAEHSLGLHAVEVPNGSLCRAQVYLRVPTRGWLSTLVVSCWAAVISLAVVTWHARLYGHDGEWRTDQVTNMVLLFVTVSAGAATYVAQHPAGAVTARMVTGLRLCGAAAIAMPAVAAVFLTTLKEQQTTSPASVIAAGTRHYILGGLIAMLGLALLCALAVTRAWLGSRADERHVGRMSPWDMTTVRPGNGDQQQGTETGQAPLEGHTMSFVELTDEFKFDEPAVGVYSAEGWHERYSWSNSAQKTALTKLSGEPPTTNPTGCGCETLANPH